MSVKVINQQHISKLQDDCVCQDDKKLLQRQLEEFLVYNQDLMEAEEVKVLMQRLR